MCKQGLRDVPLYECKGQTIRPLHTFIWVYHLNDLSTAFQPCTGGVGMALSGRGQVALMLSDVLGFPRLLLVLLVARWSQGSSRQLRVQTLQRNTHIVVTGLCSD